MNINILWNSEKSCFFIFWLISNKIKIEWFRVSLFSDALTLSYHLLWFQFRWVAWAKTSNDETAATTLFVAWFTLIKTLFYRRLLIECANSNRALIQHCTNTKFGLWKWNEFNWLCVMFPVMLNSGEYQRDRTTASINKFAFLSHVPYQHCLPRVTNMMREATACEFRRYTRKNFQSQRIVIMSHTELQKWKFWQAFFYD